MLILEKRFAITNCKKMVSKTIEVNVIGCAIYRESNGLAMSSRNERLTDQQREDGLYFKTLNLAKEKFKTNSATAVTQWVENHSKQILQVRVFSNCR
jgi:pantoate--beta-alanine ligase